MTESSPARRRPAAVVAAVAALALVAGVAGIAAWPSGGPGDAVPGRVHTPWLWQATIGQSPPGRAAIAFTTERGVFQSGGDVVVGRNGAYRVRPHPDGTEPGGLSPDGRHLVLQRPARLVDLATGRVQQLPADRLLGWSRDGRQVVAVRYHDDEVIEYGPDGRQLNDPRKADDIVVIDVAGREVRPLWSDHVHQAAPGAFAPDGQAVAVAVGDRTTPDTLKVFGLDAGRERWSAHLGPHWSLPGPAAWTPDGTRIVVYAFTGCVELSCAEVDVQHRTWRMEFIDASTGLIIPGQAVKLPAHPVAMLGWRGGTDAVFVVREFLSGEETQLSVVAVRPDGTSEVLLVAPDGVTGVAAPADLVTAGRFGGAAARPDPFAVRRDIAVWAIGICLLTVAVVMARRRQRAAADSPQAGLLRSW